MNRSLATKNVDYVVFVCLVILWGVGGVGGVDLCRNVVMVVKRLMTFIYLPNYTASLLKMPANDMQQSPFCEDNSPSAKIPEEAVYCT